MRSEGFSIRRRIFGLAVLLLLVAALALVAFIRDYAERSSDRAFDRLLGASALTIAGAVQVEDGAVTVELPFASFSMFSGSDRVFYAVEAPDGALVTGYGDLARDLPPAAGAEPVFTDLRYRGETVRVASVGRLVSSGGAAGWVTIRVAETQEAREALSSEILGNAIAPLAALTLLAVGLVWFGITRMFAPLLALERELRGRAPDDLSPVATPVPAEVRQLVGALDDFMGRLRAAMGRLSELVAEAAHEVRTPLASLRAQAEVALDEPDPAALRARVARIHQGAVQASQLVSQLLMDATVSHRLDMRARPPTSVAAVVEEVRHRLDPDAAGRVRVSIPAGDAALPGDRVVLREMLRNVVDNALTYSHGPVLIEVAAAPGREVRIAVSDRGPGIPQEEKDLVLQRFRRGRNAETRTGSGLGLTIVKRIVDAHGGTLVLADRDGGGLRVEIVLPPGPATRAGRAGAAVLAPCLLACLGFLLHPVALRADPIVYPAPAPSPGPGPARMLTIVGTTDTPLFARFVAGFQQQRPDVAVAYEETDTLPMYEDFLAGRLSPPPDLLVSSAADLQVKLANDGHAAAYASPYLSALPPWARWRSEVFGFTFEPAVIVYDPDVLAPHEVPRTHLDLAELLEEQTDRLRGRVATYDIAASGVGYLLAAQDQLISSNFWRLASAFGRVGVWLSGSSPDILDRIERGDLAIGYNVLGSYAFARQEAGSRIGVVVPDDYVLVLTRSLLIPRTAPNLDLAQAFVDFALSPAGQAVAGEETALGAVVPGSRGEWTAESIAARGRGAVQPIHLGPALMVSL
ncbi:extracellular solute-binding protein, partial [Arenibaculum sp.]|uniref:extracellular solute-binding protein n=1 Tax=Arenibaculum sp. TaxID=2865862 RepID=UPI002E151A08|nr:extracellular solute-binding protein [Arenibaculum sp.]